MQRIDHILNFELRIRDPGDPSLITLRLPVGNSTLCYRNPFMKAGEMLNSGQPEHPLQSEAIETLLVHVHPTG